ncbi:MAG: hypothetical protein ACI9KE_002851 [Polyangiales bacterium]|jgi:hypothetical protein
MIEEDFLLLLAALFLAAAASVGWAVRELRREPNRVLLTSGLGLRTIAQGLIPVVFFVPVFRLVFGTGFVPEGSPLAFLIVVVLLGVSAVAAFMALMSSGIRSQAEGWLTLVGAGRLRLELGDEREDLELSVGDVRVLRVASKPGFLQYRLPTANGELLLLAQVPSRYFELAPRGVFAEPVGLVVGWRPFADAVTSYVVPRDAQ